ncbi:hypothetical protein QF000_002138 [Paraburkholderia atlantica]
MRLEHPVHDDQRGHQQGRDEPVVFDFVHRPRAERRLGNLDAHRPVSQKIHLVDENLKDRAERERHHREVGAGHAQCGQREDRAEAGRDENRERRGHENRQAELHEQHARRVGANPEQPRMPERNLAGVADHDVETEQQDRVDHDGLDQMDVVRIARQHREHRKRDQHKCRRNEFLQIHGGPHTFLIEVLPNSPAGFIASTMSSRTSPGTSL